MDAGLPRVEFEALGRIASAVARTGGGNRAFSGKKQPIPAFNAQFSWGCWLKTDRLLEETFMCLLITLAAALAASLTWYRKGRDEAMKLETLSLMYWGAALMWMVDGFFRLAEDEPFLELTLDDVLLGLLVVACGLLAWFVLRRNPWQASRAGS
jgi:hypothetical protein